MILFFSQLLVCLNFDLEKNVLNMNNVNKIMEFHIQKNQGNTHLRSSSSCNK